MFIQFGNTLHHISRSAISNIGTDINASIAVKSQESDVANISSASTQLSKILTDLRSEMSIKNAEDIRNTLQLDLNTGLYQLILP